MLVFYFFYMQHNRFVKEAARMSSACEVLFIGDSLIHEMKETEVFTGICYINY